jgi:hypothetical protein
MVLVQISLLNYDFLNDNKLNGMGKYWLEDYNLVFIGSDGNF